MNEIKFITAEGFAPYGKVLEFSANPQNPQFEVIITEPNSPWRLAVFCVKERSCTTLEKHVTSLESFEPMTGTGLIIVASEAIPEQYEVFLLDKPVCLHKGIWHQMITLSEQTTVKIAENLEVASEFYELSKPIEAVLR